MQRLTALKRAYADIILNTAKEAAARIMVSERKAVRFQHELGAAKEQGLQMLLRLKQMLDAKVRLFFFSNRFSFAWFSNSVVLMRLMCCFNVFGVLQFRFTLQFGMLFGDRNSFLFLN